MSSQDYQGKYSPYEHGLKVILRSGNVSICVQWETFPQVSEEGMPQQQHAQFYIHIQPDSVLQGKRMLLKVTKSHIGIPRANIDIGSLKKK